jgi:hypothetical protein
VGFHDLWTDTIDHAIGLDLGFTLESAVRVAPHVRLRCAVQGTSMVIGGVPQLESRRGCRGSSSIASPAAQAAPPWARNHTTLNRSSAG